MMILSSWRQHLISLLKTPDFRKTNEKRVMILREQDFADYLNNDPNIKSKVKAVNSRLSKARLVERQLTTSLDSIVADDNLMYETLCRIKNEMNDTNGNISNAVRKYYLFSNGKEFPPLSQWRR